MPLVALPDYSGSAPTVPRLAAKSVANGGSRRVARTCSRTKAFALQSYADGSATVSFRTKLFWVFLIINACLRSVVGYAVTYYSRSAFEEIDRERHRSARCAISKGVCAARRGKSAPAG